MYKLTIESDEKEDIETALEGENMRCALWNIHNTIRSELKHGDDTVESLTRVLEEVYEETFQYTR